MTRRRRGPPPSDDSSFLPPKLRPIHIPQPTAPPPKRVTPFARTRRYIAAQRNWLAKTTEAFYCGECVHGWTDTAIAAEWATPLCPLCRRRARRLRTRQVNAKRTARRLKERNPPSAI